MCVWREKFRYECKCLNENIMKKIIVFCVAFLATMSLWALETSVKNAYGVEIWYDFDDESNIARVTYKGFYSYEYDEYTGEVVIPSTVTYGGEEYRVTSIGNGAFDDCSSLTSVTIPESVTEIGDGAFYGCSSLTSITIPEGVTSIGENTFSFCGSLTSITIPEGVTSIGPNAFSYCGSLTSVTIPSGVTTIGDWAFDSCDSLTSITIPNRVTKIGADAYRG